MNGSVLANIKRRQVKTEGADFSQQRVEQSSSQVLAQILIETPAHQLEVSFKFIC